MLKELIGPRPRLVRVSERPLRLASKPGVIGLLVEYYRSAFIKVLRALLLGGLKRL